MTDKQRMNKLERIWAVDKMISTVHFSGDKTLREAIDALGGKRKKRLRVLACGCRVRR